MRQIVRSSMRRSLSHVVGVLTVLPLLTNAAQSESESERAFRERRSNILRSQDPDRVRIDRPQSAPVTTKVEGIGENADGETVGKPQNATLSVSVSEIAAGGGPTKKHEPGILDFWIEGRYQPYEAADVSGVPMDGNMSVMYAGTKYMFGPDIMIGALAQFDSTQEIAARNGGSLSGSGWMTGPYTSIRFGPGVVFDGRMAWGTAETDGGYLEDVGETSERRLVRGTLRGSKQFSGWTVTPSVGMSYLEDKPLNATTAGAEASSTVGQGRLEVMPEVKRRFSVNETTYVEPKAAAGGFVAFDDLSKLNHALPYGEIPEVQMKAEAGVAMGVKDGLNVEAKGGVETSATPDTRDTWSGRFQLNMPLNK
jgi:hypothetical protein